MIIKYLSLIDERKHIRAISKKFFKYWTNLYPGQWSAVLWRLSSPPPLGWSAKGPMGAGASLGPIASGPVHTQTTGISARVYSKDPEGNAQSGGRDRACIVGRKASNGRH